MTTEFANNPLFIHDMDKLCAVCHKRLEKNKTHSLFESIPRLEPLMSAFQVLETISNFNIDNGPQSMCSTCFHNTTAAYKFVLICNRAHENIRHYLSHQEEMEIKHSVKPLETRTEMEVETELNGTEVEIKYLPEQAVEVDGTKEEINSDMENIETTDPDLQVQLVNLSEPSGAARRTKCKVCHRMYRHDYLPVHMRTHTGERPYECKICYKTFAQPTTLKLHEVSHSDNRAFVCNYCGKTFKLWRTLKKHERTHTGERPYKCTVCDKAFGDPSTLKDHYLVHTKEKNYQCEFCAKSFGRKTHLTQHLVSHAPEKKHECHLCGNRFTQRHSLRTHMKMSCQARKYPTHESNTNVTSIVLTLKVEDE